jgi:hypothetical protein
MFTYQTWQRVNQPSFKQDISWIWDLLESGYTKLLADLLQSSQYEYTCLSHTANYYVITNSMELSTAPEVISCVAPW